MIVKNIIITTEHRAYTHIDCNILGSGNLRHIYHARALVKLWPLFKGDCHHHHHHHCNHHHHHHRNNHHHHRNNHHHHRNNHRNYHLFIFRSLQSMCRSCCRKMRSNWKLAKIYFSKSCDKKKLFHLPTFWFDQHWKLFVSCSKTWRWDIWYKT